MKIRFLLACGVLALSALACSLFSRTTNVTNVYVAGCCQACAAPTIGALPSPTATEQVSCPAPTNTPFVFPPTASFKTLPTENNGGNDPTATKPANDPTSTPGITPTVVTFTPPAPTNTPVPTIIPPTTPPTIEPTPCHHGDDDKDEDEGGCGHEDDHDGGHTPCDQGVGKGPENCDPGNSNHNQGSNDENGGTPGDPGRGHNDNGNGNDHQPGGDQNNNSGSDHGNQDHGNQNQGDSGHGQQMNLALMPV